MHIDMLLTINFGIFNIDLEFPNTYIEMLNI